MGAECRYGVPLCPSVDCVCYSQETSEELSKSKRQFEDDAASILSEVELAMLKSVTAVSLTS